MRAKLGSVFVDAGIVEIVGVARMEAQAIADEDVEMCAQIGQHGLALIEAIEARKPGGKIPFLIHE
jgi:methylthioribose-1-phosphate isomerase